MKIRITAKGNVHDTQTGEVFTNGDVIEREQSRAEQFLAKGVAEEVDPRTLEDIADDVEKIDSVDELDKLVDAEKAGQDRKGAYEIFDSRRAELEKPKKKRSNKSE